MEELPLCRLVLGACIIFSCPFCLARFSSDPLQHSGPDSCPTAGQSWTKGLHQLVMPCVGHAFVAQIAQLRLQVAFVMGYVMRAPYDVMSMYMSLYVNDMHNLLALLLAGRSSSLHCLSQPPRLPASPAIWASGLSQAAASWLACSWGCTQRSLAPGALGRGAKEG